MGGVVSVLEGAASVLAGALSVVSLLLDLFSKRPISPPPHVQKLAEAATRLHDQKAAEATPVQQRPSPSGGNIATGRVKTGQVDEAVQEKARIIKEARQQVGVDCMNHYNFAVCGQSGVGKSSFINGILDLKGDAACSVGEVETTQKIQRFFTKQTPYLMVWDIPGAGTINHPADTYFEDKKLYVFDAILILSSDRFLAVDFEILRSARKYGTPCVFVRTKCDISVHNRAQRDGIDTLAASQLVQKDVKSNFHASLAKAGLKDSAPAPELFFISNILFFEDDAYALYNKKTKALDTSLCSMDEHKLACFIYDTAKTRAPPPEKRA